MSVAPFGELPDGTPVEAVRLTGGGLAATLLTWGAVLHDLRLDGHGPALVLALPDLPAYLAHSRHFGATAGRCANRIAGGHAVIDGHAFQLDRNYLGRHTLHGGSDGTGKRPWTLAGHDDASAHLEIVLPDGHMGFPGRIAIAATFRLLDGGVLDIAYEATADRPTLCNLAHHSYFVLDDSGGILDHTLQVLAERYTPVDAEMIPTGALDPVAGTKFDFREPRPIRQPGGGGPVVDHNYCLSEARTDLRPVARLASPASGVGLEVRTTEPGLQVYDAAPLDVAVPGLDGRRLGAFAGMALEPQVWPDAPNNPGFPSALLRPEERYRQHSQFAFSRPGPSRGR